MNIIYNLYNFKNELGLSNNLYIFPYTYLKKIKKKYIKFISIYLKDILKI